MSLPQPDLFGRVFIEARHLMKGMTVSRNGGPAFAVDRVDPLGKSDLLVRGKNTAHGGLVEIGCAPDTQFEVIT